MEESARLARPDELDAVVDLAMLGRAELIETRGGPMWARREGRALPMGPGIDAAIHATDCCVLVGTIDDTPVGYAITEIREMHDGATVGVITDIYVHPDARGVGVGEHLLNAIVSWATGAGCAALDSLALPGNRATKNFFETFGMKARSLVVSRSLIADHDGS